MRVTDLGGATVGQIVATVDSVLAAVTDGAVMLPDGLPAVARAHVAHDPRIVVGAVARLSPASARVVIDVSGPMVWASDGLGAVLELLRPGGPGQLSIIADGRTVATARSCRAAARVGRAARHGLDPERAMDELFGRHVVGAADVGLCPLVDDVDLGGLLAGWWRP